ncbi:MAG: hypothetical protein WCW54_00650 [Candidatus Paceibacterota bacterium]
MKRFPIIIISFVFLFIVSTILMFVFKLCPPAGPWPTAPWCASKMEKVDLVNAITISTDINKINYPDFYKNPNVSNVAVKDPYCAITKSEVSYPKSYLGKYEMPSVEGAPFVGEINRTIGIKDTWIKEPNLNKSCIALDSKPMRKAYEETLDRVVNLGADQISFSNYVHFSDFKNALIDGPEKAAIKEGDLRFVVDKAKEKNLKMILYLNLAPGKQVVSDIPNATWLGTLIKNWEPFVLNQAKIAEETGIDALMINHFDYQPSIKDFEDAYEKDMLVLLGKVRNVYKGKVLLMIDPLWDSNLNKLDNLLKQVDGYIYTPTTNILNNRSNKVVNVDNLKGLYLENFMNVGKGFSKYNKPIHLRILVQSSKEFLEKGWSEDMFCIKKMDDPCFQKNLEVDFSSQAIAYEAMMEAIKETDGKYFKVGGVESYGYWYTDVILPSNSQPQMAHSVRNKPAESVVREWFKR